MYASILLFNKWQIYGEACKIVFSRQFNYSIHKPYHKTEMKLVSVIKRTVTTDQMHTGVACEKVHHQLMREKNICQPNNLLDNLTGSTDKK